MIFATKYKSPFGDIFLASERDALTGLWLEEQKYYLGSLNEKTVEKNDIPIFEQTKHWLNRYFAGKKPEAGELMLAPSGSAFRQAVWKLLLDIPYGEVSTYGEIARKIAAGLGVDKMSAQAVGGAVGHNPISIIIPCHRVVGTNGSLTGYGGGIEEKVKLLKHEGVKMDRFFEPKNRIR